MKQKYYLELTDKTTGDYIFQSRFFNKPQALDKWLAKNIDFIDFKRCGCYVMLGEYKDDCWVFEKVYSYIDKEIFLNLKEKYNNEKV